MRGLSRAPLYFLDLKYGQFLAMAALAPVIFALLLLEHDDLGAARLLHDTRAHGRVGHDWRANYRCFIAADREHIAQFDLGADITLDALDGYLVADADAVLLSACPYDCKHALDPNPLSYRTPTAVSNMPRQQTNRSPTRLRFVNSGVAEAAARQSRPRRSRPSGEII